MQPILPRLFSSPILRLIFVAYATFASLYTITSFLKWNRQEDHLDQRSNSTNYNFDNIDFASFGVDIDREHSHLNSLSTSIKISKMFSKYLPDHLNQIQPYWKRAEITPHYEDITVIKVVTDDSFDELVQFAQKWQGPISATLHITAEQPYTSEDNNRFKKITDIYAQTPALSKYVDIHLIVTPPTLSYITLVNTNMNRNFARLFARSDFIVYLEPDVVPVTDFRNTFQTKKALYLPRLREGDVFVLPIFAFIDNTTTTYEIPTSKQQILNLVKQNKIGMFDINWEVGFGPTCYDLWKNAIKPYAVEEYEFHYEPTIILARDLDFWCPDRFLDNPAACVYGLYLGGSEFWVLPTDYAIQMPSPAKEKSKFDAAVANRMYKKYQWELCGHYGRQLSSMGLWETERTRHLKHQCARILLQWGKGLIGV